MTDADDLLRRALLDDEASAAVSLRVAGLPVSQTVTVVFHGRRDLASLRTYIARGALGQGDRVAPDDLLRVPCELDLAGAEDREEAERLYLEQTSALREALEAVDTVLAVWRDPLEAAARSDVEVVSPVRLDIPLPAARLLPTALVTRDRGLLVAPVCGARTLAEGRPPLGIVCAQPPDVARVYPLPEDPERCLEDFIGLAAERARGVAERLAHEEASVERFLELSGE